MFFFNMAAMEEEEEEDRLMNVTERLISPTNPSTNVKTLDEEFEMIQPVNFSQPLACCNCPGKILMVLASIMAGLGGILFGYDIGIVSGAVLQLRKQFTMSCFQQEMVVSSMLIGAVIASLTGGFIVDFLGRRLAIIINSVIFLVGAVILAIAQTYPILLHNVPNVSVLGRLIVGFGVSLSATAECIYISEISPAKWRGMLVSLNELGICLGLLIAYVVNFLFINVESGWRYMFGLSGIPALIQGIGMFFLPQSPRWLIVNGQEAKACTSIHQLHWMGDPFEEMAKIKSGLHTTHQYTFKDLFSKTDSMRQRMFVGCGVIFFQQFTGQPTVVYYASTIFQVLGFHSGGKATLATLSIGLAKLMATIASLLTVDRGGRRRFLLLGSSLMCVSILTLGMVVHYLPMGLHPSNKCQYTNNSPLNLKHINNTRNSTTSTLESLVNHSASHGQNNFNNPTRLGFSLNKKANASTTEDLVPAPVSPALKYVALSALVLFVGAFSFGFGPVSWLLLSEIFPAAIKGRAFALTTVLNWGTNLIVSLTFLDLMSSIGTAQTFYLYSFIGLVSVVFIYKYVPETKNRTLEQISAEFNSRKTRNIIPQPLIKCLTSMSSRTSTQRGRPFNTGSASEVLLENNPVET